MESWAYLGIDLGWELVHGGSWSRRGRHCCLLCLEMAVTMMLVVGEKREGTRTINVKSRWVGDEKNGKGDVCAGRWEGKDRDDRVKRKAGETQQSTRVNWLSTNTEKKVVCVNERREVACVAGWERKVCWNSAGSRGAGQRVVGNSQQKRVKGRVDLRWKGGVLLAAKRRVEEDVWE